MDMDKSAKRDSKRTEDEAVRTARKRIHFENQKENKRTIQVEERETSLDHLAKTSTAHDGRNRSNGPITNTRSNQGQLRNTALKDKDHGGHFSSQINLNPTNLIGNENNLMLASGADPKIHAFQRLRGNLATSDHNLRAHLMHGKDKSADNLKVLTTQHQESAYSLFNVRSQALSGRNSNMRPRMEAEQVSSNPFEKKPSHPTTITSTIIDSKGQTVNLLKPLKEQSYRRRQGMDHYDSTVQLASHNNSQSFGGDFPKQGEWEQNLMSARSGQQLIEMIQPADQSQPLTQRYIATADHGLERVRKGAIPQSQAVRSPGEPIGTDDLAEESFNLVKNSSKYGHIDDSFVKKYNAGGLKPASKQKRLQQSKQQLHGTSFKNNQDALLKEDLLDSETRRRVSVPPALDSFHSIHSLRSVQKEIGRGLAGLTNRAGKKSTDRDFPGAEYARHHGIQINRNLNNWRTRENSKVQTKLEKDVLRFNSQYIGQKMQGHELEGRNNQKYLGPSDWQRSLQIADLGLPARNQTKFQQNKALVSFQNDGDFFDSNDDSIDQTERPTPRIEGSLDVMNTNQKESYFASKTNEISTFFSNGPSKDYSATATTNHHYSKRKNRNNTSIKLHLALKQIDREMDKEEIVIQRASDQLMREEWKVDMAASRLAHQQSQGPTKEEEQSRNRIDVLVGESKDHSSKLFETDVESVRKKKLDLIFETAGVYSQYSQRIISLLGKTKLAACLQRVNDGFNSTLRLCSKFVEQQLEESKDQRLKQIDEINKLTSEFNEYRQANDLDLYFSKYLSKDTAKRTLELVKDLLNSEEENWRDRLKEGQQEYEKYQYSDTFERLCKLDEEMRAYKDRLRVFDEENEQVIEDQKKFKAKAPLPSHQFREDLNRLLQHNYKYGIYQSGRRVAAKLCGHFIKETMDAEAQVDDVQARKQQERITELEDQMALMREEYQRQVNELNELKERFASLQGYNKSLLAELKETKREYEAFVRSYKEEASSLKKYQEELLFLQRENHDLKQKAKEAQVEGKMKSEIRKLMKKSPKRKAGRSPDPAPASPIENPRNAEQERMIANMGKQIEGMNSTINLLNEDLQERNELIQFMEKKLKKLKTKLKQQQTEALMQNDSNDIDEKDDKEEKEMADKAVQVDIRVEKEEERHEEKQEVKLQKKKLAPRQSLRQPPPKQEKNKSTPVSVDSPRPQPDPQPQTASPPQTEPAKLNKINKVVYQTKNEQANQEVVVTEQIEQIEEKPQSDMEDTTLIDDIINITVSKQEDSKLPPEPEEINHESINKMLGGSLNEPVLSFQKLEDEMNRAQKEDEEIPEVKIFQGEQPTRPVPETRILSSAAQRPQRTRSPTIERLDDVGHVSTKLENKLAGRETKESYVQDDVLESVIHKQQAPPPAKVQKSPVESPKKVPKQGGRPHLVQLEPMQLTQRESIHQGQREPIIMYMDNSVKSSVLSGKKVTLDNYSQTEQAQMVNYACALFMKELHNMIQEEKEQEEEMKMQEIINKAQHIIIRIKNKAAPSHGVCTSDFASQNPHSPVIHGQRTSPRKSWHFDVGGSSHRTKQANPKIIPQKVTIRNMKNQQQPAASNTMLNTTLYKRSTDVISNSKESKSGSPSRDQDNILTNDVLSESRLPSNTINMTSTNFKKDLTKMFPNGAKGQFVTKRQSVVVQSQYHGGQNTESSDQQSHGRARAQLFSQGALQQRNDIDLLNQFNDQIDEKLNRYDDRY